MAIYTLADAALRHLSDEIEATPPRPHHSSLLEIANRLRAGWTFKYALNRGGWYRPGGVLSADGNPIAENLEAWAKAELEACGGDIQELVERYADSGLLVSRHSGRTHYFVASYGTAPTDFIQLEVEELQEVLDRKLFEADVLPEDIQELIDPINPGEIDAQAVGAPRYRFRRLIDINQTLTISSSSDANSAGLPRLLHEWSNSSASLHDHFSEHWIMALREHQDRYRNPVLSVTLVSRHARELKPFQWNVELTGVDLSVQLQAFDRAAGYPAAWYFHLVAGTITPPNIAYAVARDLDAGFSYLPDTEAVLIRSWVAAPYSV
jgi:hypothetical protein